MAKKAVRAVISRFCAQLEKSGIHVQDVYLFGSHLKGNAGPGSDIDLIVISDDWQPYNQRERLEILGVAAARILEPVQAVGFTVEEIESNRLTPFWADIYQRQAAPVYVIG